MRTFVLSLAMLMTIGAAANARPVILKGKAAEAFIAKYFPGADIPGPVAGDFHYVKHGRREKGHARCSVPAMGARSDGAMSECSVIY
jgi:hypothetical protein